MWLPVSMDETFEASPRERRMVARVGACGLQQLPHVHDERWHQVALRMLRVLRVLEVPKVLRVLVPRC
jgi:hypothetical protein